MSTVFNSFRRSASHDDHGDNSANRSCPDRGESSFTKMAATAPDNPMDDTTFEIVNERLVYSFNETQQDFQPAAAAAAAPMSPPPPNSIGSREGTSTPTSSTSFHANQVPDDVLDIVRSSDDEEDEPRVTHVKRPFETILVETVDEIDMPDNTEVQYADHSSNADDDDNDNDGSAEYLVSWLSKLQQNTPAMNPSSHGSTNHHDPTQSPLSSTANDNNANASPLRQMHNSVDDQRPSIIRKHPLYFLLVVLVVIPVCLDLAYLAVHGRLVPQHIGARWSKVAQTKHTARKQPPIQLEIVAERVTPVTVADDKMMVSMLESDVMISQTPLKPDGASTDPSTIVNTDPLARTTRIPKTVNSTSLFDEETDIVSNTDDRVIQSMKEALDVASTVTHTTITDLNAPAAETMVFHMSSIFVALLSPWGLVAACIAVLGYLMLPFVAEARGNNAKKCEPQTVHSTSAVRLPQCQSADVDDLCHFLRTCEGDLRRTGRASRASPSKSPLLKCHSTAAYEALTKDDLHTIGTYLRVPLLRAADNKATLLQKIVPAYEARLQGMLVPKLREVLATKKVPAAAWDKKRDLVRLAVEAGF